MTASQRKYLKNKKIWYYLHLYQPSLWFFNILNIKQVSPILGLTHIDTSNCGPSYTHCWHLKEHEWMEIVVQFTSGFLIIRGQLSVQITFHQQDCRTPDKVLYNLNTSSHFSRYSEYLSLVQIVLLKTKRMPLQFPQSLECMMHVFVVLKEQNQKHKHMFYVLVGFQTLSFPVGLFIKPSKGHKQPNLPSSWVATVHWRCFHHYLLHNPKHLFISFVDFRGTK